MYGCEAQTLWKEEENSLSVAVYTIDAYQILAERQTHNKKHPRKIVHHMNSMYVSQLATITTDLIVMLIQGTVEGRRNRGRQLMSYTHNIIVIGGLILLGEVMHHSRYHFRMLL